MQEATKLSNQIPLIDKRMEWIWKWTQLLGKINIRWYFVPAPHLNLLSLTLFLDIYRYSWLAKTHIHCHSLNCSRRDKTQVNKTGSLFHAAITFNTRETSTHGSSAPFILQREVYFWTTEGPRRTPFPSQQYLIPLKCIIADQRVCDALSSV